MLFSGCLLHRKEKAEKTDFMQNVTAKFNIIYNANKLLQEAEQNRINNTSENYQSLLPVFIEPNETSISANTKLMDSVIQKAITIINDKRDSKYIGDAYFIMAKANYEKGNYYNAAELFSYVIQTAKPNQQKLLEAALVWKCRSLLQIGYLKQTQNVLDSALRASAVHKYPSALTSATQARYNLETNNIAGAVQSLDMAIKASKNTREKIRWHYLIGQLLQQKKNYSYAASHFDKVVKSNASFELAFNAALNEMDMQKDSGDSSLMSTVSKLKKMIRDDKNKGFTDQIHYIIGTAYLQHEEEEDALKHFNLSLKEASTNQFQRATTYLSMADLYFDRATYETAKHYYDSAAALIDTNFPNYQLIHAKIDNLDELVLQLNMIANQDQLQQLAKIPEQARLKMVDSIFDSKKTKDSLTTKQTVKPQAPAFQQNFSALRNNNGGSGNTSGGFYFNNPAAVSDGFTAFKRRWGNRKLADNWRTKNKDNLSLNTNTATLQVNTDEDPASKELLLLEEKDNFIQAIPLTKETHIASDKKIIHAYLKLGELYRDRLQDKEAAVKTYTTLLERYPNLTEKDLVWYNLYRLYSELDSEKKTIYKNQLLSSSPESIYAKIINDPDYLNKLGQESQILNELYSKAYTLYTQKAYEPVIKLADSVLLIVKQDNQATVGAQLSYLRALAIGRTEPISNFEEELKNINRRYPDNKLIAPLITQHLLYIDSNRVALQDRHTALTDVEGGRQQFVDEPILTKWPELAFNRDAPTPTPRRGLAGNLSKNQTAIKVTPFNSTVGMQGRIKVAAFKKGEHDNSFRDLTLLPDSAIYYFVIHVENARINLSPSRYGIGQFNRGQYAARNLVHQLKRVDDELQLIYIGKFNSYEDVNEYQAHILAQLNAIMKIPSSSYNTFIVTEENLQQLTDFDKVNDYSIQYKEQF